MVFEIWFLGFNRKASKLERNRGKDSFKYMNRDRHRKMREIARKRDRERL